MGRKREESGPGKQALQRTWFLVSALKGEWNFNREGGHPRVREREFQLHELCGYWSRCSGSRQLGRFHKSKFLFLCPSHFGDEFLLTSSAFSSGFSRMSTMLSLCPSGSESCHHQGQPWANRNKWVTGHASLSRMDICTRHCVLLEWTTGHSLTANSSNLDDPPYLPHSPHPVTSISYDISPNKQLAPKFSSLSLYFGAVQTKIRSECE